MHLAPNRFDFEKGKISSIQNFSSGIYLLPKYTEFNVNAVGRIPYSMRWMMLGEEDEIFSIHDKKK